MATKRTRSGSSAPRTTKAAVVTDSAADRPTEFPAAGMAGTALIAGETFGAKALNYSEIGGNAIFEGDIMLGTVDQIELRNEAIRAGLDPTVEHGVAVVGKRWPDCKIPYTIAAGMPDQQRVTDAIAHWEANTALRFVPRTTEADYVEFFQGNGCWSQVGRQGGKQQISLGSGCSTGNAIHEIGHTVGLWHEQSREDRDSFVTIQWANIQPAAVHNFNQHIADGDDVGAYDYGSIMHYPRTAFSSNGQDTIVPVDANAQIGQRTGLSAGDIAAVAAIYPACTRPTPFKKVLDDGGGGVKKLRDDTGGVKKLRDDTGGFKKLRDDTGGIKKLRDDTGGIKKLRDDTGGIKKLRDDVVVKPVGDWPVGPGPRKFDLPEILTRTGLAGGGVMPFALQTGHQDPAAAQYVEQSAMADAELAAAEAELVEALLTTAGQLAEVRQQRQMLAQEMGLG
jgi:hypothetical protein